MSPPPSPQITDRLFLYSTLEEINNGFEFRKENSEYSVNHIRITETISVYYKE